ncbi:hypothetical protein HanXRQr2_Chr09g0417971 [Helianthus annuus]|uniref:Uncharacterized protein n=1 Tax=Helianthus annuus TaxID=4232 RepID=A0A9K3NAY2_HELAN|nr:hypothetical protein HanXRQr2_Chr09g0417971 [Helianthus annuus]KAJ0895773.1 hypothetical protein HanPSC8_Chr09g0404331 [Helianthus annuus]
MEYGRFPLKPHPAKFLHYKIMRSGVQCNKSGRKMQNVNKYIQCLQVWRKVIRYLVPKIIVAYITA